MIPVVHVIDTGGAGGAETVFRDVAAGLDRTLFEPTCVVSREGWLASALRERGIEPILLPAKGSLNIGYLRRLIGIIRARRARVVVAHLYGSAVYCSLAGLIARVPVISILHGQRDIAGNERFAAVKRKLLAWGSDRIVFVSHALRDELRPLLNVPESRCVVIPNGVDMSRFGGHSARPVRTEIGLRPDELLVGAIGNIRGPKAYEVLLDCAARVLKGNTRCRFVIAGDTSGSHYEKLVEQRARLGLESSVQFLGLRRDVPDVLASLDLYVLSSSKEGFSIACVEAMAAGLPVVATRSGGPEEIVEDGRTGLLVPPQDPAALAAAIESLASNPERRALMGQAGQERVRRLFTIDSSLRAYRDLLQSISR